MTDFLFPQKKYQPKIKESVIQKGIIQYLILKGWLVIRINSGCRSDNNSFVRFYTIENTNKSSGLTDLIAFKDGKHLFLEVKRVGGKMSPGQIEFKKLAESKGENVYCVDSVEQVIYLTQ